MKKKLFITVILLAVATVGAQSQTIRAFVSAGGNLSQIDGDEVYGFKKLGFTGSVGAMVPLSKSEKWLASVEVKYAQYGAFQEGYPYNYNATLPYIEIPVMAHFEDPIGGWTFGLGAVYGRLMDYTETAAWDHTGVTTAITDFEKKPYEKNDLSFVADIRFRIWKNLKFNFRYQHSLIPTKEDWIFTYNSNTWTRDTYNSVISARLIWVFNDKEPAKKKSRKRK